MTELSNSSIAKIISLEAELKKLPQLQIEIRHHFAPGIYMREMIVPKGALIVGKIHKTEHICVVTQGEFAVSNEQETRRFKASSVVHSMPGTKRALYALEDSIWINVHHNPSDERDLEKIEDIFVVETLDQYLSHSEKKQIEGGV